jgi:type I restriction enzyme R subunit
MHGMSEEAWELAAIERLAETDFWQPLTGHDIAPGSGLRDTWADPVVRPWVMDALVRLNKDVPTQHLQQALADILATTSQDAITENHRVHDLMVNGYRGLTYTDGDGREVNPTIWLLSPNADENVYHAVRQVTVRAGDHERRFDVVLYVNGLPLVIIELKKAGSEKADVAAAHAQLATYVRELPMAFRFCVLTVASDGLLAKYGTPFTPFNHFAPWNVDDSGSPLTAYDTDDVGNHRTGLEVLIDGLFNVERFLQIVRDYVAFDATDAGPGQADRQAAPVLRGDQGRRQHHRCGPSNGKAGVVWHTQGSGKSMEMELYTAKVMRHPALLNPTIVVITDRTELDGQLFDRGSSRASCCPRSRCRSRAARTCARR